MLNASRAMRAVAMTSLAALAVLAGSAGATAADFPSTSFGFTYGATRVNGVGTFYNRNVEYKGLIGIPALTCRGIIVYSHVGNGAGQSGSICNFDTAVTQTYAFDVSAPADAPGGATEVEVRLTDGAHHFVGPSYWFYRL